MIRIVLAFFNVVASSQILPLLPKAAAKVIQFVDLQKNKTKIPPGGGILHLLLYRFYEKSLSGILCNLAFPVLTVARLYRARRDILASSVILE